MPQVMPAKVRDTGGIESPYPSLTRPRRFRLPASMGEIRGHPSGCKPLPTLASVEKLRQRAEGHGHRNFFEPTDYRRFIADVVARLNRRIAAKVTEERGTQSAAYPPNQRA